MQVKYLILILLSSACLLQVRAQDKKQLATHSLLDTTRKPRPSSPDSLKPAAAAKDSVVVVKKKKHDPSKATIRSAIIPGWGQAYNREYWKIPIVWGALAIPAVTFVYNNTWYKRTKKAYPIVLAGDTTQYGQIYSGLFYYNSDQGKLVPYDAATLQQARNQFRQNRDFSLLWFFILWGVNVVDATVFGHLKDFDVSDNLSMHVEPTFNTVLNTPGVSLVFNMGSKRKAQPKKLAGYY